MTASVRVLPSGHEFVSEGHSTLLEAGLRAGLALKYGCSNGNCGQCLARVTSGEVHKIRRHDFRIGAAEKANGHVLMCCNTAVTDVVLETNEASGVNDIPCQQITARVRHVQTHSDMVTLVHLKTPRTQRLRFLAGQYVQLGGTDIASAEHSIGSCPCDDMNLHFQVPVRVGDAFSEWVSQHLKYGDLVSITGPRGDFVLDEDSPRTLIFIAWRTGFAPIRSLLEHAMALEIATRIQLVWVTRGPQERYLDNLCRSWHDALDDFFYVPVDVLEIEGEGGLNRLFSQRLNPGASGLAGCDFYVAGNRWLVNEVPRFLRKNGVPAGQVKTDELLHD